VSTFMKILKTLVIAIGMAMTLNAQTQLVLGSPETTEYARTNSILAEANRKASLEAFKSCRSPANRIWVLQANKAAKSWRDFEGLARRAEKSNKIAARAVVMVTPPEAVAAAVSAPATTTPTSTAETK
jgi:hypothetical protein